MPDRYISKNNFSVYFPLLPFLSLMLNVCPPCYQKVRDMEGRHYVIDQGL